MNKLAGLVRTFAATAVLLSASVPAVKAQDVSEDQIKAARATIAALGVTNSFDNILPNLAERLKNTLIQASPNHQELITATVDDKALSLAARRADLENEAATIYAKTFSLEELNAITEFYNSAAGKKLLNDGPIASRELLKAADIWASGVSRDLTQEATKSLDEKVGSTQPAAAEGAVQAPAQ
ncbi:DUF2059 domain-containing protein [Ensifer adhaerens]|jgi:hypothetical protein|uniref:DUF2059 domain-containing protein n=1 Tax=Ensifer adhaerens TaxID=106592 RepID=A0A9Q8YC31_ENSAD|nr:MULTISPECIES: DUF2059 domain-containing protein [Ensifer]KSV65900.1 hypothetical protein N182_09160 [Sinorhizobium sp. GL2]KSV79726.1 hypothetical protein N185_00960 [Sinorhizobium sp. GW3]OWZ92983.1 hypothetical protein B9J07_14350 [Sinorhizobium sp. LM21]ANK72589.1 hypothetical protein FA04_08095 [Ensifer adhaerens]KDP74555.1 hypothetical protein FA04_05955 [Ensifer adhaerens]